jgi:hypothetical protein
MEQEQSELIRKAETTVLGAVFGIEIFIRSNGKGFALTRYSPEDIIITDGLNAEDAFTRHNAVLPLAIGSRIKRHMTTCHEL